MRKKFKFNPKQIRGMGIAAALVLVLFGGWYGYQRFSGKIPSIHRPWHRAEAVKRVGVRIEPVRVPAPHETPTPPAVPGRERAKLAIILDDWGLNESLLRQAIDLRRPVTLAVLPKLAHSREIARQAAAQGLGVMLHMPMQSKNEYAAKEHEVITVGMPEARVLRYLDEALESVPGVEGVNNHQGSAATSDARIMNLVLTHLKKKNLFFIDSFVIATTTGPRVAREVGIPFARRDVFIDNVAEVEPTKAQLRKAIQKALTNGSAIAIGHDKAPTLEAIRQMIPEIEKAGVKLVLAKELVK